MCDGHGKSEKEQMSDCVFEVLKRGLEARVVTYAMHIVYNTIQSVV